MRSSQRAWHRRALARIAAPVLVAALGTATSGCPSEEEPVVEATCDAGNQAFVRRTLLALNGRRAWSQAEVNAWAEVLTKLEEREESRQAARKMVARAMMFEDDTFRERWSVFLMDSLRVLRSLFARPSASWFDKVQATTCWGPELENLDDKGALAAWVRDNPPTAQTPPYPSFRIGQLMASTIALDDLTPLYRAQIFHMLQFPMGGANVDELEREAARRMNFGTTFNDAYLHRDPGCAYCHNAVSSPTAYNDPELNRFWPLSGRLEQAVFGTDNAADDPITYWSVFRVMDVRLDDGGTAPWGWYRKHCGGFDVPAAVDPLAVDTKFASVTGNYASIWALEESLNKGIAQLRAGGLVVNEDGTADPDAAFAYLVAANITEKVWNEVVGTPLTIAHNFPRNQTQRDLLDSLTNVFIDSGFSLKSLLAEIVTHPMFNLPAADSWCDGAPYSLKPVFNPWSVDEEDETARGNSAGDAVHHLSTALLQRATHRALEWGPPPAFPSTPEDEADMAAIGMFVSGGKPGFRGLGFQPKLSWEHRYGVCAWPGHDDFITVLARDALGVPNATLQDALIALKDRLVGEPFIHPLEIDPLAAIMGQPLETPAANLDVPTIDAALRIACGAYLASPQNLLGGLAPADGTTVPKLTPSHRAYAPSCGAISALFDESNAPYIVSCFDGSLAVSKR